MASIDDLIAMLLRREGGFIDHPDDRGGPTNFGITQATARAAGYKGPMRDLPQSLAADIYRKRYWEDTGFDRVNTLMPRIAAELFDTGVNMGPAVATGFLQRALNALNRRERDWGDVPQSRTIDAATLSALKGLEKTRGKAGGNGTAPRARSPAGCPLHRDCRGAARERELRVRLARRTHRRFPRLIDSPRERHSMSIVEGIIAPVAKLLDRIIPDKEARERAKLELIQLEGSHELKLIEARMAAIVAEANAADPWTSRARPSFLYVMYVLLLWSIPMGLIAAADPATAKAIGEGMGAYLEAIPEPLYMLFGTGYLGYTAARSWGKAKGSDR